MKELLDKILSCLDKNGISTISDLARISDIDKNDISIILDFLCEENFCIKEDNSYQISVGGKMFLERPIWPYKNRPYQFESLYKRIKYLALLLNALLILFLGFATFLKDSKKDVAPNNKDIEVIKTEDSLKQFKEPIDTVNFK